MGVGLTITRDELENELAGRPTLNQRHRVLTYLRLGDRRPRKRTHCPGQECFADSPLISWARVVRRLARQWTQLFWLAIATSELPRQRR